MNDDGCGIALFMWSFRAVPERLAWLSGAVPGVCCPIAARRPALDLDGLPAARRLYAVLVRVQLMRDSVAAAARDQPAVDGHGEHERDHETQREAPQKSPSPRPAAIAPGTIRMKPLSTISIVVIETVSEAKATPAARRKPRPARSTGRIVSE